MKNFNQGAVLLFILAKSHWVLRAIKQSLKYINLIFRRVFVFCTEVAQSLASLRKVPWSVQSQIGLDEKEWLGFNKHRRNLKFSRLEQELLFAGEHPVRFSFSLFILSSLLYLFILVLPEDWLSARWSGWGSSEHLSHFSTLWTVQATLAALVFPMVIAFVTVFLQRRAAAETFIHLYILDSGAVAAGLSSLALVLVMAVQYALIPSYGSAWLPLWAAIDAGWFLLNAALTTYFLFRTIEFLRPEIQQKVVQRYAISVALPRDVRRLSAQLILDQAHDKGWITAPGYLGDEFPNAPKVMLRNYGRRDGEVQGLCSFKEPVRLVNVRLWPLRLVVASWSSFARKWAKQQASQQVNRNQNECSVLNLPMTLGSVYSGSMHLAEVTSGPTLKPWQLAVLRHSYVFRAKKTERFEIKVQSILFELEADARSAAERSDMNRFEQAYDELLELHQLLLGASLAPADDGSVGSWGMLPGDNSFFNKPLHEEWSNSYRSLFLAAISGMSNETGPIRRLCYLASHLNCEALKQSPLQIREYLLKLNTVLMHQLGVWWSHRIEEQGVIEHGHYQLTQLRAPLHRVYEEVVTSFVAGWERARESMAKLPKLSKSFDWFQARTLCSLYMTHIQETSRMLLEAIYRGDQIAAEWLADVLNKSLSDFEYEHEPIALFGKTAYLTVDQILNDWAEVSNGLGISAQDMKLDEQTEKMMQRAVLKSALQNYWTDIRLIVVELLLSWAEQNESENLNNSLAMYMAIGMLEGRQWRSGDSQSKSLSTLSAPTYLNAKVRQYAADGQWRSGYIGRLSSFVERIKDIERPSMVSGRIYSRSGADDVDSLQEQQLALLFYFSNFEWTPSNGLKRQLEIWITAQYQSIEIMRQKVSCWLERLAQPDEVAPRALHALLVRTQKSHDSTQAKTWCSSGLTSFRNLIVNTRDKVLEAAPIDPKKLEQIGLYASSEGFDKSKGKFPLAMFDVINLSRQSLEGFTLNIQQVQKGGLTTIEMAQRAVNEDEWLAETMANQVAAIVLGDVLFAANKRSFFVPSADSYWKVLNTEALALLQKGMRPILLLDNATRPEWVWQWQHADYDGDYPRPNELSVQRLKDKGDAYLCNFNDIEVYVAPLFMGQSFLMAKETFKTLVFQEFANDQCVNVTTTEREESKFLVDMQLTFARSVSIGFDEVVQLDYTSSKDLQE